MKILYISHRIPYPPNKGDKIRSFNEIKYLSRNHQVDLACLADNPNDLKYKAVLEGYCRNVHIEPLNTLTAKARGILNLLSGGTISVQYFYSKKLQQVIDEWFSLSTYDAAICFSSPMAEYIFRSPLPAPRSPLQAPRSRLQSPSSQLPAPRSNLIMDFCDVDSDKWRQYAENTGIPLNLIYRTEYKRLLSYENKINRIFDRSIFVSQKEADLFKLLVPQAQRISVIPNGVDSNYFSPEPPTISPLPAPISPLPAPPRSPLPAPPCSPLPSPSSLLFTGAMDYQANIDGVTWFGREIFPILRKKFPNLEFVIVGSNPTSTVKALANGNNIRVTGFVEDIRPYYAAADICVIPLRMARGVQNKVLEAMSMGKAVVSTPAAIQGISTEGHRHLLAADTPEAFIKAITGLLSDHEKRKQLGEAARDYVKSHYSWNTSMAKFDDVLNHY